MKKLTVLLLLTVLLSASLYSQTFQYEVKVKYNQSAGETSAEIKVTATKGEGSFTFSLMTNDPIHGQVLMKSEPLKSKTHTFRNVKPGKYFVKVEDSAGNQAGKTVNIKENEN
jgi:hypothetical protein